MNKIKVLLADQHAVFRAGLNLILEKEGDFKVVKSVGDADAIMELDNASIPDLFVIDVDLPTTDGFDCAIEIRERYPNSKIVILSHNICDRCVRSALKAKVNGYLLKDIEVNDLISALRMVHAGELVFNHRFGYRVPTSFSPTDSAKGILNSRELEILRWVAIGLSNKVIAGKIGISDKTISTHLFNIFKKLDVESRTAAVLCALKLGLFDIGDLDVLQSKHEVFKTADD